MEILLKVAKFSLDIEQMGKILRLMLIKCSLSVEIMLKVQQILSQNGNNVEIRVRFALSIWKWCCNQPNLGVSLRIYMMLKPNFKRFSLKIDAMLKIIRKYCSLKVEVMLKLSQNGSSVVILSEIAQEKLSQHWIGVEISSLRIELMRIDISNGPIISRHISVSGLEN